jgi:hypothetical protein
MSTPVADSKTPILISLGIGALALVIGLLASSAIGKLLAGLLAASGSIPAGVGMWKGIQQETQTTLGLSLLALVLDLAVAAALIIWAIVVFWV